MFESIKNLYFCHRFMESLGTMVSFFSQKVKDKGALIRKLSLKHEAAENLGKRGPESNGLRHGVRTTAQMYILYIPKPELFLLFAACRFIDQLDRWWRPSSVRAWSVFLTEQSPVVGLC